MGRPDIRILADGEELSRVSAEEFVRLANEAVEASGRFSVALSGFLVSWEEKAKTLRAVLQGPYQPDRLPA